MKKRFIFGGVLVVALGVCDYGDRLGRAGYQWYKVPPGLSAAPAAASVGDTRVQ